MGTSIDLGQLEAYKQHIARADQLKGSIHEIYGSGEYAGTQLSTFPGNVENYFAYLYRKYPRTAAPPNPLLFPAAFPRTQPIPQATIRADDNYNHFLLLIGAAKSHIPAVTAVRDTWIIRKDYLSAVKSAVFAWRDWNTSIYDFFDRGIVQKGGENLIDVEYDESGHSRASTFTEFFALLNQFPLYGNGTKIQAAQTAENMKNEYAHKARTSIQEMLDITTHNRVNGNTCLDGFNARETVINGIIQNATALIGHLNSL